MNELRDINIIEWNAPKLEILDLSNNRLQLARLFDNQPVTECQNLKYLDLSYQTLTPSDCFYIFSLFTEMPNYGARVTWRLQNLVYFDIFHTPCVWNWKNSYYFAENNSLQFVNLTSTAIEYLNDQVQCAENVQLKTELLNLNNNGLQCINKEFFKLCNWSSLNILKFRNNYLGYGKQLCGNETTSGSLDFLSPLWNLTDLNLRENFMPDDLPSDFLRNHFNLEQLHLSRMYLKDLTCSIGHMKKLCLLDLWANKINCLNTPQLRDINSNIHCTPTRKSISKTFQLNLMLNPLRCSCECLHFYESMNNVQNVVVFVNFTHYQFSFDNGKKVNLSRLKYILFKLSHQCVPEYWFIDVNNFICTLAIYTTILVGAVLFRFRHTLRYTWLKHKMHRLYLERHLLDPKYQFDAFVSCDRTGATWVKKNFLPYLENAQTELKFSVAQRFLCWNYCHN